MHFSVEFSELTAEKWHLSAILSSRAN